MRTLCITCALFFSLCSFALAGPALDKLNGTWNCDGKSFVAANPHIRDTLAANMQADLGKGTGKRLSSAEIVGFLERKFSELTMTFNTSRKECSIKDDGKLSKVRFTVISESAEAVTLQMDGEEVVFTLTGPKSMTMKPKASSSNAMPFIRK